MLQHRLQVSRKVMRDYENLMQSYEHFKDTKEFDYIIESGKLRLEIMQNKEQQDYRKQCLKIREVYKEKQEEYPHV
jgi:hypothetical protein